MNKTYKYTLTAHEKKEISFDTGVARLAIANGDGVDGSTTVVMSEITKQHSGDLVSFIDGADAPFADFIVNIEPVQSGSGDPSPTNVRPITGWTGATINVSDEDASDPTTYNIDWEDTAGTVYGGTLNVKTGVLTVDRTTVVFDGTENYINYTNAIVCNKSIPVGFSVIGDDIISSHATHSYVHFATNAKNSIQFSKSFFDVSNADELKAYLQTQNTAETPFQYSYKLETPVTYHLTPVEIRSLLGLNNVWADCGPVNVRYFVQSTQPMIDYIDDKTENVVKVFKATGHYGGTYTLDDVTCDELCDYARNHSNIVIKATRASSAIAYDIFILSDYIGTSATFRNAIITTAIGGGYVLEVRELQADNGNSTNALTVRYININADSGS